MLSWLKDYFLYNVGAGVSRAPRISDPKVAVPFLLFASISYFYGSFFGLFNIAFLKSDLTYVLPFTLFIFPSLLEEIVFRGLLIPQNVGKKSVVKKISYLSISTLLFVLWHPLNALTINTGAQGFFLNPHFLFIVALLGVTCGYTYMSSKCLWVPVLIHWFTVVVWVVFLGGRNLVLE